MRLAGMFLLHLGEGSQGVSGVPDLESLLSRLLEQARLAWPGITVDDGTFVRHLGERARGAPDAAARLASLHVTDLYLACACAQGDPAAIAAFDTQLLSLVPGHVSLAGAPTGFGEELKQELRTRLLVANGRERPRIADYSGQGPLGAWLRVCAGRAAVDLHRARAPHRMLEGDRELALRAPGPDPEIALMKARYRVEFEEAFRSTLASLPVRDGNVLRLHYFDGLTAGTIAALFRVSARTVQHWLLQTRQQILDGTRRLLEQRLQLSSTELDALIGLLQSQLDVSVRKYLEKKSP